jgi:hypothetical protein
MENRFLKTFLFPFLRYFLGTSFGYRSPVTFKQRCGSESGIRCFLPLDPGWVPIKLRSGIPIRDEYPGSYFLELGNNFWVKIFKFFDADPKSF